MGSKSDIQTSPKGRKGIKNHRSQHRSKLAKHDIHQGGNSIRFIQERRVHHTGCYNPETRKGLGAVLFTLGIPSIIAGTIMTIVSLTDNENENKYPKSFSAVGPILLAFAVVFFTLGIFLHSAYVQKAFKDCFSLDNPNSCCRMRCRAVCQCLSPDDTVIINQAAMKALQAEPGKSVLKRNRLLSDSMLYTSTMNNSEDLKSENGDVFDEENVDRQNNHNQAKRNSRGVHFSDGDADGEKRKRTSSLTSASDNGSLLSLKHCKIHPKSDDIWWTDEHKKKSWQVEQVDDPKYEQLQTTEL